MLFDGRHVAGRGASAVSASKNLVAMAGLNEIID